MRERIDDAERNHRRELHGLIGEIVEIADGVERLRAVATPEAAAQLGTVLQQVEELLVGHGVSVYRPAVGDQVDGLACDVMATVTNPNLRAGTVTRVLRAGYRQSERVVRRAGVEVVKE
jgi:molecular chaperone GrpE (heat shock protein)